MGLQTRWARTPGGPAELRDEVTEALGRLPCQLIPAPSLSPPSLLPPLGFHQGGTLRLPFLSRNGDGGLLAGGCGKPESGGHCRVVRPRP